MGERFKSYYIDNRGFFLRPFSIKGRIGRREYVCALIIYLVIFILADTLIKTGNLSDGESFMMWALGAAGYVFFICEAVKRCHDRNNPGIYILIPFYSLFLCFAPGDHGMNDYGNSPKDVQKSENVEEEME